jgi:hypothetical protein
VWLHGGYILFEGPTDNLPPEEQAREILGVYFPNTKIVNLSMYPFDEAPVDHLNRSLRKALGPNLIRWLALVVPFLQYILQQVLKLPSPDRYNLANSLLNRRSRLYVTSTHVDLVMNLNNISVPVRLAGLDRNPGWAPDFGRVVLFHFE